MNLRMILAPITFPLALVAETVSVIVTGKECGVGNWFFDRKVGDPKGRLTQTRQEAIAEHERKP